jgi:hypothetical protein
MGKDDMRKRLASLSFAEKIKILEKLRDRSLTLAASGLRRGSSTQEVQVSNQVAAKATKEG